MGRAKSGAPLIKNVRSIKIENHTFKEFFDQFIKDNKYKIQLVSIFFVAVFSAFYAWYSFNNGAVNICAKGTASCLQFKLDEHKGEFYAALTALILISLTSFIFGIRTILRGNKNKNS